MMVGRVSSPFNLLLAAAVFTLSACTVTASTVSEENPTTQAPEPTVDAAATAEPAPTPERAPQAIVFLRPVDGVGQIFIGFSRGDNEQQLTNAAVESSQATLSADSSQVVFGREGDIYVIGVDGSGLEQLTSGDSFDAFPELSPDGTRLAFTRVSGQAAHIIVMDLAIGSMETLVSDSSAFRPVWSPDGTKIAFHGDLEPAEIQPSALFIVDVETGTPEQVTDNDESRFATWSPDGSMLAFHRISTSEQDAGGRASRDIWVVDVETGEERIAVDDAAIDRSPSWSATEDQIAFFRDGSADNDLEIMILDVATGDVTTTGISGSMPDW